jgi:enoyl-CoA hydratase/carnithine racemase
MPERSAGGPESEGERAAGSGSAGGPGSSTGGPEALAGGKLLLDRPAEAVARLRIANPERRNALDHEILAAIAAALPRLDDGIATRCVLITGTPPLFSAGYDIAEFTEEAFEDEAEALVAHPFQAAMEAIVAHPWPTVAAINGLCLGGGLELAVSCDLRIAGGGAKLGMPPAKLGLVYGHTGLRRFLDTIGLPRTREMFFTGRNLTAEGAERIGLVNEVVEDEEIEEAGVRLAHEIAVAAPLSTRGNKRVIDVLAANPILTPAQEEELVELRRACFGSVDFREGVRAFAEKRRPIWRGE